MSKRSRSVSRSPSLDKSTENRSRALSQTSSPERSKIHLPDTSNQPIEVMHCSLPPHKPLSFPSYEDYEVHYRQVHVNRCAECGRNFPTSHLLNLHIEENHDPLIGARRERGEKTYGCFIEDCDRKCSTPPKRRRHLIDKHMFPPSYNFYIVNDGIDKQTSMLRSTNARRRRISSSTTAPEESRLRRRQSLQPDPKPASNSVHAQDNASQQAPEGTEIDELAMSMSALRFVPPSVAKGTGRSGKKA